MHVSLIHLNPTTMLILHLLLLVDVALVFSTVDKVYKIVIYT